MAEHRVGLVQLLHPAGNRLDRLAKNLGQLLLAGLGPYWQFINLDQRFDNQRLLADTSISIPEPAHQYMQRVARFLDAFDPCEMAVNP